MNVRTVMPWREFPKEGRECSLLKVLEMSGRDMMNTGPVLGKERNQMTPEIPSSHINLSLHGHGVFCLLCFRVPHKADKIKFSCKHESCQVQFKLCVDLEFLL